MKLILIMLALCLNLEKPTKAEAADGITFFASLKRTFQDIDRLASRGRIAGTVKKAEPNALTGDFIKSCYYQRDPNTEVKVQFKYVEKQDGKRLQVIAFEAKSSLAQELKIAENYYSTPIRDTGDQLEAKLKSTDGKNLTIKFRQELRAPHLVYAEIERSMGPFEWMSWNDEFAYCLLYR